MKTFRCTLRRVCHLPAAVLVLGMARAAAETIYFSNFNFQNSDGGAGIGGTSGRLATEFFTLGDPATIRGAALLVRNADTIEHDFEAWLYAADGPNSRPGTLLTAFTGADDLIDAGATELAAFSHPGFTLSAGTQYWIVLGMAEMAGTESALWKLTLSNNADVSGSTVVVDPTPGTATANFHSIPRLESPTSPFLT